jgi:lipopolysaccharide biosynthesis protein
MAQRNRLIAIYLPQYHPFKENDEWWGKGFTEWRNVVKAKPRFLGHYQPHLPADLGFYDLRVPEVRNEQAKMAKEHGIYGFCYYHYWFNGHLLMERPLEDMLKSKEPDFPFMICWANENWTRAWDGGEKEILIQQNYSEEDDREHIQYLMKFLRDPRYIRINGKPVICIYRTTNIPNIDKTLSIWREEACKENIELYICRFESFSEEGGKYITNNMDAAIEFQPHNSKQYLGNKKIIKRGINKIFRNIFISPAFNLEVQHLVPQPPTGG